MSQCQCGAPCSACQTCGWKCRKWEGLNQLKTDIPKLAPLPSLDTINLDLALSAGVVAFLSTPTFHPGQCDQGAVDVAVAAMPCNRALDCHVTLLEFTPSERDCYLFKGLNLENEDETTIHLVLLLNRKLHT